MIFLSLIDWQEKEMNFLSEKSRKVDCPNCDGEGRVEEECDCCGNESESHCDECDGGGNVPFSHLTEYAQRAYLSESRYLMAIKEDFHKFAEFTLKDEAKLYFDSGFIAYCSTTTKEIQLKALK